jgi:hypothetical protein
MKNRPAAGFCIFCRKIKEEAAMSEELKSTVNELYEKIDRLKG